MSNRESGRRGQGREDRESHSGGREDYGDDRERERERYETEFNRGVYGQGPQAEGEWRPAGGFGDGAYRGSGSTGREGGFGVRGGYGPRGEYGSQGGYGSRSGSYGGYEEDFGRGEGEWSRPGLGSERGDWGRPGGQSYGGAYGRTLMGSGAERGDWGRRSGYNPGQSFGYDRGLRGGAFERGSYGSGSTGGFGVGEPERPHGRFAGRGPKGYKRSDDRIKEDVSDRLEQDSFIDATSIEVRVENGEVTLEGNVDDRRTKRMAEDVVEDVPGVKQVHNRIRVERGDGGAHSSGRSASGASHSGAATSPSGSGSTSRGGRARS